MRDKREEVKRIRWKSKREYGSKQEKKSGKKEGREKRGRNKRRKEAEKET